MFDGPGKHIPDPVEIGLHSDPGNMTRFVGLSIPDPETKSIRRKGRDSCREIDVAVIEIERSALPMMAVYRAFTPAHLHGSLDRVRVGKSLLAVGFPLG